MTRTSCVWSLSTSMSQIQGTTIARMAKVVIQYFSQPALYSSVANVIQKITRGVYFTNKKLFRTNGLENTMSTLSSELKIDIPADVNPIPAKVEATASFGWIQKGVQDFLSAPFLSVLYGALFAGLCAGLFFATLNAPWFTLAFLTGLVFIGPFVAAGLYAASRDIERGITPSIVGSLRLVIKRKTDLALFSLLLTLVFAAWIRFSALLLAVTTSTLNPTVNAYMSLLSSSDGLITLAFFVGIGLLLTTVVFIFSAVAIPYILDKNVNFISAMTTSYQTVTANSAAMFIWAATIVLLTAIGVATAFAGLAIIFPVLGYATWYSYRALIK